MFLLLTAVIYSAVFGISVAFYYTRLGARAIYGGASAVVIDILAILAGVYTVYIARVAFDAGVIFPHVLAIAVIGSVVSAMHLARWFVRNRFPARVRV